VKELVFHRLLLPALERWADKVGFHDGSYRATYAQHGDRVLRLADAMRTELGLRPGDRFAVMSCNSHQYLELYHAGLLGAGLINPLNLRLAGPELQHILADSATSVVFVDAVFAEHLLRNIEPVRGDLPLRRVVLIGDGDVAHDVRYEALIESGRPLVPDEPDETDPAVLMYTGGTTGVARGAVLEQRAELLNVYHIGIALELSDRRVYLHQTPMFHAASMAAILGIPATGGTSVFVPLFEPGAVMDAIERHGVDWTMMVPTMIAMVLDHPRFKPGRLGSLDDLVYGASPMPAALLDRLVELLPDVRLWQGYGMTECSSVLTFLTADDHRRGGRVVHSAGRPVMGVGLSVRDDLGHAVPCGTNGEVWARGGNVMREYWHRPAETADVFRDGWYRTGDEGHVDDEGFLYLVDRVKDMIVTGGENVYSIEVENAISGLPGVAQVAVIGIPHRVLGEQVHAIVVLAPGAEMTPHDIKAHVRARLAGYKVPKSVELRTEPLPLSGALKPLKRELRAPYWAASGD
jgi:long-chain acyl-CoA synthetase